MSSGVRRAALYRRGMRRPVDDEILLGDNLPLLRELAGETFQLIYVDPPFNTGRTRKHAILRRP